MTGRVLTREEFEAARELDGLEPLPYARDWLMHEVTDLGPGTYYRYQVRGELVCLPEDSIDRKFCWRVPKLGWRYFMA